MPCPYPLGHFVLTQNPTLQVWKGGAPALFVGEAAVVGVNFVGAHFH